MENFSQAFGISGCESIAIFVAQNQGAKIPPRPVRLPPGVRHGGRHRILFSLLLFFGGGQLVLPFLDGEAESAALGALLPAADGLLLLSVLYGTAPMWGTTGALDE